MGFSFGPSIPIMLLTGSISVARWAWRRWRQSIDEANQPAFPYMNSKNR
jgi:hypothetical protein